MGSGSSGRDGKRQSAAMNPSNQLWCEERVVIGSGWDCARRGVECYGIWPTHDGIEIVRVPWEDAAGSAEKWQLRSEEQTECVQAHQVPDNFLYLVLRRYRTSLLRGNTTLGC